MQTFTFTEGVPNLKAVVPPPVPSSQSIPEWYRKIKPSSNNNVKACSPFLDSLLSGYTQVTWCDIVVTLKDGKPTFKSDSKIKLFTIRSSPSLPVDESYWPAEFVWHRYWIPSLPSGYSMLVTHPLNRLNLPFTTLSAVVDADVSLLNPIGNIPFYIKKDFIGVIPKGTPMYQLLPFKRDSWESNTVEYDEDKKTAYLEHAQSLGEHSYRKKLRHKKEYK